MVLEKLELLPAGQFALHLPPKGGLEVELALTGFEKHPGLVDGAFPAAEGFVEALPFPDGRFDGHFLFFT